MSWFHSNFNARNDVFGSIGPTRMACGMFCHGKVCFQNFVSFNPFTPRVSYSDMKVLLTFESVDEILWCDHSNETLSAVLSHGTVYI